jgi:hypothetical protein
MLFGEHIHGNVLSVECEVGFRDVMKGVCWRVFRLEELKEKYLLRKGVRCDEDGYKRWIIGLDTSGEMTNGCRLVLDVWRDRR